MKKKWVLFLVLVIMVISLIGCSTGSATPEPGASANLDGPALLEARCATCHSLNQVRNTQSDAAGWTEIVDRMVSKGAVLSTDERDVLVKYLAATYK